MSPLAPTTQNTLFGDRVPRVKDLLDDIGIGPAKRSYTANELQRLRDSNTEGAVRISDARIFDRIKRDSTMANGGGESDGQRMRPPPFDMSAPMMSRVGFGAYPFKGQHVVHNGGNHSVNQSPRNMPTRDQMMRRGYPNKDMKMTSRNVEMQIRISLNKEVKLKEAENAWKPKHLQKEPEDTSNDLHRQVRSILNKLTAQNFAALSEQFKNLPIDTTEKLGEVINLVFDKAVDEPNFSECYAQLCLFLSNRSKEMDQSSECKFFKRALIEKLQREFEQNVANQHTMEAALKPLKQKLKDFEKAKNAAGVRETKLLIAEEDSRIRRRLVSTVQFIGELFKLDMLTVRIMNLCLQTLIDHGTDEKLECACKLLTTIGMKLERTPVDKVKTNDLTAFMSKLRQITERKKAKISTRTKFMIMEVLDMRANGWRKLLIV